MTENTNPLSKFFRQPAIYLRLPSQGIGYPQGTLEMPTNGEIPIYPMTAIDEVTYRTPDALFNGEAVVQVIQSCVPSIKNAWAIPNIDLDAILIAIRIASYGHEIDVDTMCPNCQNESEFGLDLRSVLDKLRSADYSKPAVIGDLQVRFRPLDYKEMTDNSQLQFEQQKTLQVLTNNEVDERDKVTRLNEMMKKITQVTVRAIAQSIKEITTPDGITDNINHIEEFLNKCDRAVFNKIRDTALALREESEMQPLEIDCPECKHHYQQIFTLDMSRFFEADS